MTSGHYFDFRAASADGRVHRGQIQAASVDDAGALLLERGLSPFELSLAARVRQYRSSASRRELAIAFRSLASLVTAGLPLDRALAATEPVCRGALRNALVTVRADLVEGQSLAAALAAREGIFPAITVAMARAGELASRLPDALEQIASQLESEADLVARVQGALAYPLMLTIGGAASVGVIATVVVPRFAVLLADLGQELPPSTALLLNVSTFLAQWWWLLLVLAAGCGALMLAWLRSDTGREQWHTSLLALPVIGTLRLSLGSVRALRAMGGALSSGMPIVSALNLARDASADAAIAMRLGQATESVMRGRPLAASLTETGAVAPVALQLVAIGESSGALGPMAERAALVLAQDTDRQLSAAVRLLEPLLIIVFGGLVAFVAAALLQAVYSVRPGQ